MKPNRDAPVSNWTWCGTAPRTWKPTYADRGTTREVILHIHNPTGREEICRATDTCSVGSYNGQTETTVLCAGYGFVAGAERRRRADRLFSAL